MKGLAMKAEISSLLFILTLIFFVLLLVVFQVRKKKVQQTWFDNLLLGLLLASFGFGLFLVIMPAAPTDTGLMGDYAILYGCFPMNLDMFLLILIIFPLGIGLTGLFYCAATIIRRIKGNKGFKKGDL